MFDVTHMPSQADIHVCRFTVVDHFIIHNVTIVCFESLEATQLFAQWVPTGEAAVAGEAELQGLVLRLATDDFIAPQQRRRSPMHRQSVGSLRLLNGEELSARLSRAGGST